MRTIAYVSANVKRLSPEQASRYTRVTDERSAVAAEPADVGVRTRIIGVAAGLIAAGGTGAATTCAIAAGAFVQAPTIYRLFGDKRGLLEAVAESSLERYVEEKSSRVPHPYPVEDLRNGWDFMSPLAWPIPGLFAIMSGDPHQQEVSPAAVAGLEVLRRLIKKIALAGRLKVSETRAVALVHSVCVGTVHTLLADPEERRDPSLSEAAREAVLAATTGDAIFRGDPVPRIAAATLRACLHGTSTLSSGERHF